MLRKVVHALIILLTLFSERESYVAQAYVKT